MIFNDCETYCEVDIGVAGVSRYAEDDSLELKCWSFAFDDDEPLIWIPGNPPPYNLFNRIESHEPMRSFNAWFEMQIWHHYCVKKLGWPAIPDSQWQDTQADALAFGLPADLYNCALATNSKYQKCQHGHQVMLKICRPCKPSKDHPYTKWEKTDSLQDHLDLYKYCMQDVRTERGIYKSLPYHVTDPTHQERKIWEMTVRSNRRGVPIDVVSVHATQAKIEEKVARLQEEFSALMGDCSLKISQRDAIRAHLNERYLNGQLPNMQGQTIIDLLKNKKVFIPDPAKDILRIYLLSNYTSIKKFKRIIAQFCKDGTVKDNIRYHGAATGRDTAQGFQLQNLTRSSIEEEELALTMIRENTLEQVEFVFGNMLFLASCLCRAIIMAPPGYKHMNADLSQIEARMRAWIALEEDYLQNFRDGLCPYKTAAARMFNVPYDDIKKSDSIRQAGKVGDLAGGYQGGEKAFKKMGAKHGLAVSDKDAKLWTNLFRMAHPKLVATWKAFGVAAKHAILKPGTIQNVETNSLFSFLFKEEMLYMRLPNARLLVFPFARYEMWMMPWGERAMSVTHMWCNNEKGNKWERRGISGASLMQSADQGLSRDVLMESALRVEALGYPTIFRVHDEVDCLVPDDARFNLEVFKREFEKVPEWCADLPLTSDVWEGARYKK